MRRLRPLLLVALLAVLAAACSVAGGPPVSPTPAPTPLPTSAPSPVTTAEQAVAAVIAREPRLTGIMARNPDLIGQGTWYEVAPASGVGAFLVTIHVGWGDCPSGCIDRHEWLYAVAPDGTVTLQSESGPPVPDEVWPSPGGDGRTGISLTALAGPICPVETEPPDPACAPRAVPGAVVRVLDVGGVEVMRATLDGGGFAFLALEAGTYTLEPQPVEGLMGTPAPASVTVTDGVAVPIVLSYDTGIR